MDDQRDENQFVVDDVKKIIEQAIESIIGGKDFDDKTVNEWSGLIIDEIKTNLIELQKPYKYIVYCIIMQANGFALHSANSNYWNVGIDDVCTVKWENKSMECVLSVFGLSI